MKRKANAPLAQTQIIRKPKYQRQNVSLINPPDTRALGSKAEKKNLDVQQTLTPALANDWSTPVCINILPIGTGASQRVGRKCLMKSLLVRIVCGASSGAGTQFRYLCVYDKQSNAALPAVTDILTLNDFQSPNNLSNNERFVTVIDKILPLPQGSATQLVCDVEYRKLNLDVVFNATNGSTIADITSGSLIHMMIPADGLTTSTMNVYSRVRFTDI